ncbi:hypothetical protein E2C01_065588 [Portunus trituberculatus]|uniref:Uncharacterized protein n=1 Tax=Portunus trituberculatus TaxID=210409 RepID=A0A5B7HS64_PORTR|nr:hypothetical protein [Portunus trituberculatus]
MSWEGPVSFADADLLDGGKRWKTGWEWQQVSPSVVAAAVSWAGSGALAACWPQGAGLHPWPEVAAYFPAYPGRTKYPITACGWTEGNPEWLIIRKGECTPMFQYV